MIGIAEPAVVEVEKFVAGDAIIDGMDDCNPVMKVYLFCHRYESHMQRVARVPPPCGVVGANIITSSVFTTHA